MARVDGEICRPADMDRTFTFRTVRAGTLMRWGLTPATVLGAGLPLPGAGPRVISQVVSPKRGSRRIAHSRA
jgi:hypothetical protein